MTIFAAQTQTVILSRPLTDGDHVFTELTLSPPSIATLRALQATKPRPGIEQALALISALSGRSTSVLEGLTPDDLVALADTAGRMITLPPKVPGHGPGKRKKRKFK